MKIIMEHWFWFLMTVAVLVWYSTITVWVAIKGSMDIKNMLRRLKETSEAESEITTPPEPCEMAKK